MINEEPPSVRERLCLEHFRKHRKNLLKFVARKFSWIPEGDREDILQKAFIALVGIPPMADSEEAPAGPTGARCDLLCAKAVKAYLFQATVLYAKEWAKHNLEEDMRSVSLDDPDTQAELEAQSIREDHGNVYASLDAQLDSHKIYAWLLADLPRTVQLFVHHYYVEEDSIQRIADLFGIKDKTFVFRAIKRGRDMMMPKLLELRRMRASGEA